MWAQIFDRMACFGLGELFIKSVAKQYQKHELDKHLWITLGQNEALY